MTGKVLVASAELTARVAHEARVAREHDPIRVVSSVIAGIDPAVELGELLFVMEESPVVAPPRSRLFLPTATAFLHGFLLGELTNTSDALVVFVGP